MNIVSNAANDTNYIQHAHLPLPSPPLAPVCGDDPPSHRGTPGRLPQTHVLREAAHICRDRICEVGEKLDGRSPSRMGLGKLGWVHPLRGGNSALERRSRVGLCCWSIFSCRLSPQAVILEQCKLCTSITYPLSFWPRPSPGWPRPSGMCTSRWTACTCSSSPPRPATS